MNILLQFLEVLAPVITALLAQWAMTGVKAASGLIENAPAWLQRILVVAIAFGLGQASQALDLVLPEALSGLTLENLEALIAAGLAFGFHVGDKIRAPSAATARLLVLLALFVTPAIAACQTGSATVTVVDRSRLRVEVSPRTFRGEVGDTITFHAIAVDTVSADTIPAIFRWTSQDSLGVRVDPVSGLATLRRAGEYQVFATVQRIVAMLIMREQDNGSWREVFTIERQPYYASTGIVPPRLEIEVGQSANLCAYVETETGEHYVAEGTEWSIDDPSIASIGVTSVACPTWAPGMPFPEQAMRIPAELIRTRSRVG